MSQAALATRLGVSRAAVNKLEHAELVGGITVAKLAQVATALNCSLVYALVPNTTLEETVRGEARQRAASILAYADRTMALEAQAVDQHRQVDAVERLAVELIDHGDLWQGSSVAPDGPIARP